MKHALCSREENYHDDSDFYAIYYDDEVGTLQKEYIGSTRHAGGCYSVATCKDEDILLMAEYALAKMYYDALKNLDMNNYENPTVKNLAHIHSVVMRADGIYRPRGKPQVRWSKDEVAEIRRGCVRKSQYGTWTQSERLEIQFNDGRVAWVDISKVYPNRNLLTEYELRHQAKQLARMRHWHANFVKNGLVSMA